MLQRLRKRAHGQEGFTLIELLVVILIIGILAAVAIPAFLNQRSKAQDANVKSDINSAQLAEETFSTNNDTGAYTTGTSAPADLEGVEPSLTQGFKTAANGGSALTIDTSTPGGATVPTNGSVAYNITGTDAKGITFSLVKYSDGSMQRVCTVPGGIGTTGGCKLASGTSGNGTW